MLAIETHKLTKTYEGRGGCREISLSVPRGSVFGLLGPNGAGKSTLVKMLVGLLHPSSGEAKILDKPLKDISVRKKVGFLPENFRYHDWLTGEDLLRFHASLFKLSSQEAAQRIPKILEEIGLAEQGNKQIGNYSKGMQQRIGLGCALLPNPDLLFLDEPTSALDPIGRKLVRDLIVSLKKEGKTIFLNSHLLSELETVCDEIAIIKEGRLIFQGNWREIAAHNFKIKVVAKAEIQSDILERLVSQGYPLLSCGSAGTSGTGREYLFSCKDSQDTPQLIKGLVEAEVQLYEVHPVWDSLENLFLEYIAHEGRSEGGSPLC
ncbi:ABC transporter ATP-binding protein [Desulforamulus ruminis]|uniref:ABC transporter related protein n=1 Tax=Desulforamulus ruminis (strain ATCC 23193 / DSM 2154 / NCIMB 8452 / DL) TaxID=696281 RepID=F6DN82_DESRL|nr:ABC transporter ATP-binding protein [Desulforamulus ruminis]AEG60671.1 ABC transporter related protein [Desulforamulus ruminis DSM 2154]